MPYSTVVLTCGISALAPRNIIGQLLRAETSPLVFPPGRQNPEPRDLKADPDEAMLAAVGLLDELPDQPDPSAISAEFSVLHALREHGRLAGAVTLHLLHTPTFGGRLSVELQRPLLEAHFGASLVIHELLSFDPSQRQGLAMASGAFIGEVSRILATCTPHTACFAPIGGYKVMVALGHVAASFHKFPSVYLHEDSQVLQELAPIPIELPAASRAILETTARMVGHGTSFPELPEDKREAIVGNPAFFARVDDMVCLNELGHFLRLAASPLHLSPQVAKLCDRDGTLCNHLRNLHAKALASPQPPEIHHEKDLKDIKHSEIVWHLCKIAGRDSYRILWRLHHEGMLIHYVWTRHQDYDRDIDSKKYIGDPIPDDATLESWSTLDS